MCPSKRDKYVHYAKHTLPSHSVPVMQKLLIVVSLALATQGTLGVAVWGQCGGTGYSGSTVCDAGSTW
jgi:hypothetical protein